MDGNSGVPVALGLGLLLRECQRAIEVEPDDEDAPHVLRSSSLGAFDLDEVQAAVKEILGRLRNEVSSQKPIEQEVSDLVQVDGEAAMKKAGDVVRNDVVEGGRPKVSEETRRLEEEKRVLEEKVRRLEEHHRDRAMEEEKRTEEEGRRREEKEKEKGKEKKGKQRMQDKGEGASGQVDKGKPRSRAQRSTDGSPKRTSADPASPGKNTRSSKRKVKPSRRALGSDYP